MTDWLTPDEWRAVALSLRVSFWATVVSLPLGIAVAYVLARYRFWGRQLLNGLVHLPLILPPVVTGYLLLLTFGRRGYVGQFLDQWFGIVLAFRWTGAVLAAAVMAFPLMVRAIRLAFEATLQRVVELGVKRGERTPWAKTVRTCQQILQVADALWTFLETCGIEPTNNAAERALRQSVIQRKISHGVQSRQGAICRSRLLTVTTTLRQQGRDVWVFLEQAWIAHHHGGVMPSLLPDP
jgi:molybdate transport system permease protein